MRITHIVDNLRLGGTQNLALRTVRKLIERGHQVSVCVLGPEEGCFDWDWLPSDLTFLGLPADYRKWWQVARLKTHLSSLISRQKPDILHSWLWTSDYITALSNQREKRPHFSHIVDRRNWQLSSKFKHRIRRWLTRRAFRNSRASFFAVSKAAREFAVETIGIDRERAFVVYNSIEPGDFDSLFLNSPDFSMEPLRLGMASRLEPEKGHLVMLDALKILREKGHKVVLKMTGVGGIEEDVKQRVRELGLENCTEFMGFVESVSIFFDEVDIFIVPSVDSEGLPTTILEAMASGRPVIATDIGGAIEAIKDGEHGRIVAPNDPTVLAEAVMELCGNSNKAKSMISAARKVVESTFSMNAMVGLINSHYERAVAGNS